VFQGYIIALKVTAVSKAFLHTCAWLLKAS
jgi:hypothetical protein